MDEDQRVEFIRDLVDVIRWLRSFHRWSLHGSSLGFGPRGWHSKWPHS
jgi:hypothetical protein